MAGAVLLLLPSLAARAVSEADYVPAGRYLRRVFPTNQFLGDVVYCTGANYVRREHTTEKIDLKLNIFLPPAEDQHTNRPAIIHTHGGGWSAAVMDSGKGTRTLDMGCEFAQCGYVFLTIGYRGESKILPNAKEICCEDIKTAIDWLRAQAGQYRVDPTRIALMGGSAGAMSAMDVAYNRKTKYYDPAISAVFDGWGATDVNNMQPGGPPILIVDGTKDFLANNNRSILEQAEKIGLPHRALWVPDVGHEPLFPYWGSYVPLFFAKHLAGIKLADGLPALPTQLAAVAKGSATVELSWTAGSNNVAGFEIERLPAHYGINQTNHKTRLEPSARRFTVIKKAGPEVHSYQDKDIDPKSVYFYRVRAFNAAGFSDYSDLVNVFARQDVEQ